MLSEHEHDVSPSSWSTAKPDDVGRSEWKQNATVCLVSRPSHLSGCRGACSTWAGWPCSEVPAPKTCVGPERAGGGTARSLTPSYRPLGAVAIEPQQSSRCLDLHSTHSTRASTSSSTARSWWRKSTRAFLSATSLASTTLGEGPVASTDRWLSYIRGSSSLGGWAVASS